MADRIDPRWKALGSLTVTIDRIKARAKKQKVVSLTDTEHRKATEALVVLLDKRAIDTFKARRAGG